MLDHHMRTAASREETETRGEEAGRVIERLVREHQRRILPSLRRIERAIVRLVYRHGLGHCQLAELARCYVDLSDRTAEHIRWEEADLFPPLLACKASHQLLSADAELYDRFVEMEDEHHALEAIFQRIRVVTDNYHAPVAACPEYAGLLADFSALEATLRRHWNVEEEFLLE